MSQDRKIKTENQRTYQFCAPFIHSNNFIDQIQKALNLIEKWLSDIVPFQLESLELQNNFTKEEGGQRVEYLTLCETLSANAEFIAALRYTHPDLGLGEESQPVSGRMFMTDISIQKNNQEVVFSLQINCSTPTQLFSHPPLRIRPRIIKLLAEKIGFIDGEQLLTDTIETLSTDDDVVRFFDFLCSKKRRIPIVVISAINYKTWGLTTTKPPEYILSEQQLGWLQKRCFSYAKIYKATFQAGCAISNLLGECFSVFDGAIRIYYPSFSLDDDPYIHPFFLKEYIWYCKKDNFSGPRGFASKLFSILRFYNVSNFVFQDSLFIPTLRMQKIHRFLDKEKKSHTDIKELQDYISLLEKQIDDQKNEIDNIRLENKKLTDEISCLRSDKDRLIALNDKLRAQPEKSLSQISLPSKYKDFSPWIEQLLVGRLKLHPRASRNLKDADYQNPQLVAKAILLLANEYRNMRIGLCEPKVFEEACNKLKLRYGKAITDNRAGEEGESYFVDYFGCRRRLDFHLRNGSSKETKYTLAIYFFWDEDNKIVVIGDLPKHLDTRAT